MPGPGGRERARERESRGERARESSRERKIESDIYRERSDQRSRGRNALKVLATAEVTGGEVGPGAGWGVEGGP